MKIASIVLACIISLSAAGELLAQEPVQGLQDLIGARGRDGEGQMERRGYGYIRTDKSGDSAYSYWRDNRSGQCITVRTTQGRYASIVYTLDFDCNQGGGPGGNYSGYNPNPSNDVDGMQITRNVKRNGGDYTNFTVRNMKECARACARDNNCHSFNYGKERRDCWLKNNVPAGVPNNTVISGIKHDYNSGDYNPNPPNDVDGMQITRNVKRNGGDYTNFTVRNMKECARACARDNNCRSFNYGKERRDCWLKNNVPAGVPNNTVISGIKRR